ncbi:unnamed protein product (macronuclear) [Paramecium tetraurelia]|uniref:SH3 domain-containing protein n=1 Tax=Paramecium tetraurelia TaxID=5888 RepID=A0BDE8_PARTE|nr:uncharacterized protein GSPATT00027593001 [Paramecium tetraurelia]CAK56565.1 unnamed protein product [Paramecium tetraurelia]|eukprot:XP_001423963.1 hypothetical protein (macronuclear) [Paramecium tetraurelia strain d4-2]
MYSLQKLVPNNKIQIKPGAFSQHQKLNQSVDGVLQIQQKSQQQLQTQIQIVNKKEPSKQLNNKQELLQILGNAQNNQRQTKSISPTTTPQKQRSNRKLNFNQITEQDALFLNSSNAMANMIIENILNKDEYYQKILKDNQDLKDQLTKLQLTLNELKKKYQSSELTNKDLHQNLQRERQLYQNQLLHINEQIQSMKPLKQNLQMEQKKSESLTKQLQDQIAINNGLKSFICDNCLLCIEFLSFFQKIVLHFQPQVTQAYESLIQISKHSTAFILEFISKTQNLNLPALRNCVLPEEFDVNGFFQTVESLKLNESLEISFRNKINNVTKHSIQRTNNTPPPPEPLKPIRNASASLHEQYHSFLDASGPLSITQANPYFTELDTIEKQRVLNKEKQRNQLALQLNAANRMNQEICENSNYFQIVQESNENETIYMDQHVFREQDKQSKRNKENQQQNCQYVIAKYDYKAQKDVDLSFKKGDQIKLLKKTTNGWWYGEDKNQVRGYFPHNFFQSVG